MHVCVYTIHHIYMSHQYAPLPNFMSCFENLLRSVSTPRVCGYGTSPGAWESYQCLHHQNEWLSFNCPLLSEGWGSESAPSIYPRISGALVFCKACVGNHGYCEFVRSIPCYVQKMVTVLPHTPLLSLWLLCSLGFRAGWESGEDFT